MLDDYEDRVITPAMPPCRARFCCYSWNGFVM